MVALFGMAARRTTATAPPPPGFGVPHLVAAAANYTGHPTIPENGRLEDFRTYDEMLRAELGLPVGTRVLAGPHFYSTGWQTNFASTQLDDVYADGYRFGVQNLKTGSELTWAGVANGSHDAAITTFVNSVPDDFVCVLMVNHEPENDGVQPNADGGTWENQYGPDWSRAEARMATVVANLARPNVFFGVCHMHITFPTSGQPGDLGFNNRNPENWNPWQYMSAPVKARTIFGPDIYTGWDDKATPTSWTSNTAVISSAEQSRIPNGSYVQVFQSNGTTLLHPGPFHVVSKTGSTGNPRTITVSPAWPSTPPAGSTVRKLDIFEHDYQAMVDYVTAAGWGVSQYAISEHTINNDYFVDDATTAWVWDNDISPYLEGLADQGKLAYYAHFNRSDTAGASGQNGWVDLPGELTAVGGMARRLNTGAGGGGTTGIAFVGAAENTANTATPSLTKPTAAATGHYAVTQFTCRDTVTLTDPAGWTVHVSADAGGGRFRVYGRFIDGSETSTNTVPDMNGGVSRWAAAMVVYSGVHASTPINGTPGVVTSAVSNTVQTTGTTTTTVDDCTILSLASNRSGTAIVTTYTPPTGYAGRADVVQSTNAGATAAAADNSGQPAGTHGADQWVTDVATASWCGTTLALRPA